MSKPKTITKILITKNKKAYFDYEILDTFEAGIVLLGAEVKAVKQHHVNLKGSFIKSIGLELFAENIHISAYQPKNQPDYKPDRKRKILLNRQEINKIINQLDSHGLTAVPLEIFQIKGLIKMTLGLVRGRKKYDKRQVLKKKTQDKDIKQALSRL